MANKAHREILKWGVEQWNKWREENESIKPDLQLATLRGWDLIGANLNGSDLIGSDLSGATLIGANLSRANLIRANLRDADLSGTNLHGADLRSAYLNGAHLSGANLNGATLRGADLIGSDLSGANLIRASLRGANLIRASLRGANLIRASLRGANLRRAHLSGADLSDANLWRANLSRANLSGANLSDADLRGANHRDAALDGANLIRASLRGAELRRATLSGANLIEANLIEADLYKANLSGASLRRADLSGTNLHGANLSGADLTDADLKYTGLVETDFTNATITGCRTYGASAWNVTLVGTVQNNLVITKEGEPVVTVDDLEVAQFIYLLLNRRKLRNVLTTLGEKAVLILGRFTERKALLDGIADKLRGLGYLPIIFDFDRPTDRDVTETVKILAGLSLFVIADITNPRSVPLELQATVPDYMVPFVTIVQRGQPVFGMFDDLPGKYHWALPLLEYNTTESLLATFKPKVVTPALEKLGEVRRRKARVPQRRSAEE